MKFQEFLGTSGIITEFKEKKGISGILGYFCRQQIEYQTLDKIL
jgi:hypothetical protein